MNSNYWEQVEKICRHTVALILATVIAVHLLNTGDALAGTLEATPKLIVTYKQNDNIYAEDPDELPPNNDDLVTASFIDYLVGLMLSYREGQHLFKVEGNAGYEQWISIDGWVKDVPDGDDSSSDYDFVTIKMGAFYRYSSSRFILELSDDITQTRDLQEVFGEATDALGYWALYTDNIAKVSVKTSPTKKTKLLLTYYYETLVFSDPENDRVTPADSYRHGAIARTEYSATGKTSLILDVQGYQQVFEEIDDEVTGQDNLEAADSNVIQAMAGIRYRFNNASYVEALGGYAQRTFDDLSDRTVPLPAPLAGTRAYDLEDMSDPLARLSFISMISKRYSLELTGVQGISTYGQNLFFTYSSGYAALTYHITPKVRTSVSGSYKQSIYDIEKNGREWMWDDDRVDNTTYASANITWDILQKRDQGTLTIAAGYTHQNRDSSVDSPGDYIPLYQASSLKKDSYDAVMNVYYVRVQMLPTILLGDE